MDVTSKPKSGGTGSGLMSKLLTVAVVGAVLRAVWDRLQSWVGSVGERPVGDAPPPGAARDTAADEAEAAPGGFKRLLRSIDEYQRQRAWAGFPLRLPVAQPLPLELLHHLLVGFRHLVFPSLPPPMRYQGGV